MKLCGFDVGLKQPFFLIAGPCVVESEALQTEVAGRLKEMTTELGIPFIFKSSYDKANRSSGTSFRGPGITSWSSLYKTALVNYVDKSITICELPSLLYSCYYSSD